MHMNVFEMETKSYVNSLKVLPPTKMWASINRNVDQLHLCRMLISVVSTMGSHEVADVTRKIVDSARELVNADRATLYLVNHQNSTIRASHSVDVQGLEIPIGSGIAGGVAEKGNWELIRNVYEDDRFFSDIDKTGYRTHSMMCGPIRNAKATSLPSYSSSTSCRPALQGIKQTHGTGRARCAFFGRRCHPGAMRQ